MGCVRLSDVDGTGMLISLASLASSTNDENEEEHNVWCPLIDQVNTVGPALASYTGVQATAQVSQSSPQRLGSERVHSSPSHVECVERQPEEGVFQRQFFFFKVDQWT